MSNAVAGLIGVCTVAAVVSGSTTALANVTSPYFYEVLLDTDNDPSTGGMVPVQQAGSSEQVKGIDHIVRVRAGVQTDAVMREPAPAAMMPEVLERRVLQWDGADFMPVDTDTSMYPLGTADGGGQVEFGAPLSALDTPQGAIRGVFHASWFGGSANDYTAPFILYPPRRAPALSAVGLAALGFALFIVGVRRRARRPRLLAAAVLSGLTVASLAWAATITLDGAFTDWVAIRPIVTDPRGDSSTGDPAEDILAGYVTQDAANMFFRMDLAGLIQPPPP